MSDQLLLDLPQETKFDVFHAANPHVYNMLVSLARQWVSRTGRHKLGIATLFERARWEIALTTVGEDFRLNNSYRAYYARLIMAREWDLRGLFDLRASEADQWISAGPQ
jgi:hypothetical protein